MSGQIVDATIVAALKQRNTIEGKKAIKEGQMPDAWKNKPKKLAQKDRDARWTVNIHQGVNGGVKAGHWGGVKPGQFAGMGVALDAPRPAGGDGRCFAAGRARRSGSGVYFAGFGTNGFVGGLGIASPPRLRLLEPIALAVQLQNMDMMRQPIEQRAGETLTAEDAGPFLEWQVRRDDGRAAFVSKSSSAPVRESGT
jgi:hypothetical protein